MATGTFKDAFDANIAIELPQAAGRAAAAAGRPVSLSNEDLAAINAITAKLIASPSTEATLAAVLAKIIASPATEATSAAILAKIIAAPATAANQTTLIAKDFATQATLAAVLAKIIAAPATEAKQDTLQSSVAGLATQTTLAAVLAKIISSPATEAKQDVINAKDFATQATLAAVLAKLITSPATEAKQDALQTSITTLTALIGELTADPETDPAAASTSLLQAVRGTNELLQPDPNAVPVSDCGTLVHRLPTAAANTNAVRVKSGSTIAHKLALHVERASNCFLKVYNSNANPPTEADIPLWTFTLAPGRDWDFDFKGHVFSLGLGYRLTTGVADNNTSPVAAGDVLGLNLSYT